jgi:hypothetical protein
VNRLFPCAELLLLTNLFFGIVVAEPAMSLVSSVLEFGGDLKGAYEVYQNDECFIDRSKWRDDLKQPLPFVEVGVPCPSDPYPFAQSAPEAEDDVAWNDRFFEIPV